MTADASTVEPGPADRRTVVQMVFGHMAAQTLAAAVRLGLPERVGDTERRAGDLAADIGTDPAATHRLLRALAALGFLTESESGGFRLTGPGQLLRHDRPDSLSAFVGMFLDPTMVESWKHLDASVRSGRTSFDEVFGTDFFSHLAANPELGATFNASMQQGSRHTATVLPDEVDLSGVGTVADIGGGDGTVLAHLLAAHPGLRGVLFDTADGSAQAAAVFATQGVTDRARVVTGDFFHGAPEGADLYLIKSVVHDWDDDQVTTILGHIRGVVPEYGRLLIIEPVLPERVDASLPPLMYLSDLNMLVNVGGRERTESEFRQLCDRAGFAVSSVRPLPPPASMSLIDAVPTATPRTTVLAR